MPTWHNWKDLLDNCQLAIAERLGHGVESIDTLASMISSEKITSLKNNFVKIPLIDISSSLIRERCAKRQNIRYLVPPDVENYIKTYELYQ